MKKGKRQTVRVEKVLWRLYYEKFRDDESDLPWSTFDSTMGQPGDAPAFGFLLAVFPDRDRGPNEIGRYIMWGWDYYFWHPEHQEFWGCNFTGLLDRLMSRSSLPIGAWFTGRTVHSTIFRQVMDAANADPDFQPKSAKRRIETEFHKEGPETKRMVADGS